jgi:radical SAM superfamily enzyme YgiQ (UPF0313 family)
VKKILFFEPCAPNSYALKRFPMPRLGSLVLGAILKKAGHDVTVFVEDIRPPRMEDLLAADVVAISALTPTAPRAYELAKKLREQGTTTVLGGPHVTFMVDEALAYTDYVVRGEAENGIVALVEAVTSGSGLEDVPGLSYRRDGEVHHNPPAEPVEVLDDLPDPDFSLLQGGIPVTALGRVTPLYTSRGCPHDCSFCSVTKMFGRQYRFRSTARVLAELQGMDLRRRSIFFCDDHLAAKKSRLHELLEGILSRGLRFPWVAQVRADLARDERLVSLMRRAGCRTLYVGLESVNPSTLEEYNKGQSLSEIESCIAILHKHGIRIYGMFVIGADADTRQTVGATLDFAIKNRIDSAQFTVLTPFPGTDCYADLERQGRILHRDWSLYDLHNAVYQPAHMTPQELQTDVSNGLRRFYSVGRIIGDIARFRFFEARSKIYNRIYQLRAAARWTTADR